MTTNKELQERNRRTSIEFMHYLEKDPQNKYGDKAKVEAFIFGAREYLDEELERMLSEGMDVNAGDVNNTTALMEATHISTVRLLLSHGADPNIIDNEGQNALFRILYYGLPQRRIMPVIKALLEAGADTTCDEDGITALELFSERYKDERIYQLLQQKYDEQQKGKQQRGSELSVSSSENTNVKTPSSKFEEEDSEDYILTDEEDTGSAVVKKSLNNRQSVRPKNNVSVNPSAQAGERRVETISGVEYAFRWCPAGTFMMGSPEDEKNRSSRETQHEVTLTEGFWLLEHEVTQEMWESVMGNNPSQFKGEKTVSRNEFKETIGKLKGLMNSSQHWEDEVTQEMWESVNGNKPSHFKRDTLPVEQVSWDDCQEFIGKLNSLFNSSQHFRLPTESEWEYACRAGTTTVFSFGNCLNGDQANCWGEFPYGTETKGPYMAKTTPVKSYAPNAWGLYDMHGNVREWCEDWYDDYPSGSVTDPCGPNSGLFRVGRGGSWNDLAMYCRSAKRGRYGPAYCDGRLGFRLALSSTR